MKILLSAFACEPGKGSEPGVGWNWALELARQGHEVTVLTRANNRESIERALEGRGPEGLSFVYYDLPRWAMWWKKGMRGVYLYYQLWQIGAYRAIHRAFKPNSFDVVHHLTFGTFRQASFLGRLDAPFIVGPLGGGDKTPRRLGRSFPVLGQWKEAIRSVSNKLMLLDPTVRRMFQDASVIYLKTAESRQALPLRYRHKCVLAMEIGVESSRISPRAFVPDTPKFLFVGRLLYLKGIHLALDAFAEVLRQRQDAQLVIVGLGPEERWLKRRAEALGIAHAVEWLGWMPQEDVRKIYHESLAMVFPSLRDSSGNVVLEAFSAGTPVICLNTGGPGALVPDEAGLKIDCAEASVASVVRDLAEAMLTLANNRDFAVRMSEAALRHARGQDWSAAVSRIYATLPARLSSRAAVPGQ